MAPFNVLVLALAALIPLIVGFVWYHPKVFGTIWLQEIGKTPDDLRTGNMAKIFGFTYLFSFFFAIVLMQASIHQWGAFSMIGGKTETALPSFTAFMDDYGTAFRTFKHGMLHGFIISTFTGLAILGVNSLFELKSWRYIFLNVGFWILCGVLMGGVICQFS